MFNSIKGSSTKVVSRDVTHAIMSHYSAPISSISYKSKKYQSTNSLIPKAKNTSMLPYNMTTKVKIISNFSRNFSKMFTSYKRAAKERHCFGPHYKRLHNRAPKITRESITKVVDEYMDIINEKIETGFYNDAQDHVDAMIATIKENMVTYKKRRTVMLDIARKRMLEERKNGKGVEEDEIRETSHVIDLSLDADGEFSVVTKKNIPLSDLIPEDEVVFTLEEESALYAWRCVLLVNLTPQQWYTCIKSHISAGSEATVSRVVDAMNEITQNPYKNPVQLTLSRAELGLSRIYNHDIFDNPIFNERFWRMAMSKCGNGDFTSGLIPNCEYVGADWLEVEEFYFDHYASYDSDASRNISPSKLEKMAQLASSTAAHVVSSLNPDIPSCYYNSLYYIASQSAKDGSLDFSYSCIDQLFPFPLVPKPDMRLITYFAQYCIQYKNTDLLISIIDTFTERNITIPSQFPLIPLMDLLAIRGDLNSARKVMAIALSSNYQLYVARCKATSTPFPSSFIEYDSEGRFVGGNRALFDSLFDDVNQPVTSLTDRLLLELHTPHSYLTDLYEIPVSEFMNINLVNSYIRVLVTNGLCDDVLCVLDRVLSSVSSYHTSNINADYIVTNPDTVGNLPFSSASSNSSKNIQDSALSLTRLALTPNSDTFSLSMLACQKQERWSDLMHVFLTQEMGANRLIMNAVSFSDLNVALVPQSMHHSMPINMFDNEYFKQNYQTVVNRVIVETDILTNPHEHTHGRQNAAGIAAEQLETVRNINHVFKTHTLTDSTDSRTLIDGFSDTPIPEELKMDVARLFFVKPIISVSKNMYAYSLALEACQHLQAYQTSIAIATHMKEVAVVEKVIKVRKALESQFVTNIADAYLDLKSDSNTNVNFEMDVAEFDDESDIDGDVEEEVDRSLQLPSLDSEMESSAVKDYKTEFDDDVDVDKNTDMSDVTDINNLISEDGFSNVVIELQQGLDSLNRQPILKINYGGTISHMISMSLNKHRRDMMMDELIYLYTSNEKQGKKRSNIVSTVQPDAICALLVLDHIFNLTHRGTIMSTVAFKTSLLSQSNDPVDLEKLDPLKPHFSKMDNSRAELPRPLKFMIDRKKIADDINFRNADPDYNLMRELSQTLHYNTENSMRAVQMITSQIENSPIFNSVNPYFHGTALSPDGYKECSPAMYVASLFDHLKPRVCVKAISPSSTFENADFLENSTSKSRSLAMILMRSLDSINKSDYERAGIDWKASYSSGTHHPRVILHKMNSLRYFKSIRNLVRNCLNLGEYSYFKQSGKWSSFPQTQPAPLTHSGSSSGSKQKYQHSSSLRESPKLDSNKGTNNDVDSEGKHVDSEYNRRDFSSYDAIYGRRSSKSETNDVDESLLSNPFMRDVKLNDEYERRLYRNPSFAITETELRRRLLKKDLSVGIHVGGGRVIGVGKSMVSSAEIDAMLNMQLTQQHRFVNPRDATSAISSDPRVSQRNRKLVKGYTIKWIKDALRRRKAYSHLLSTLDKDEILSDALIIHGLKHTVAACNSIPNRDYNCNKYILAFGKMHVSLRVSLAILKKYYEKNLFVARAGTGTISEVDPTIFMTNAGAEMGGGTNTTTALYLQRLAPAHIIEMYEKSFLPITYANIFAASRLSRNRTVSSLLRSFDDFLLSHPEIVIRPGQPHAIEYIRQRITGISGGLEFDKYDVGPDGRVFMRGQDIVSRAVVEKCMGSLDSHTTSIFLNSYSDTHPLIYNLQKSYNRVKRPPARISHYLHVSKAPLIDYGVVIMQNFSSETSPWFNNSQDVTASQVIGRSELFGGQHLLKEKEGVGSGIDVSAMGLQVPLVSVTQETRENIDSEGKTIQKKKVKKINQFSKEEDSSESKKTSKQNKSPDVESSKEDDEGVDPDMCDVLAPEESKITLDSFGRKTRIVRKEIYSNTDIFNSLSEGDFFKNDAVDSTENEDTALLLKSIRHDLCHTEALNTIWLMRKQSYIRAILSHAMYFMSDKYRFRAPDNVIKQQINVAINEKNERMTQLSSKVGRGLGLFSSKEAQKRGGRSSMNRVKRLRRLTTTIYDSESSIRNLRSIMSQMKVNALQFSRSIDGLFKTRSTQELMKNGFNLRSAGKSQLLPKMIVRTPLLTADTAYNPATNSGSNINPLKKGALQKLYSKSAKTSIGGRESRALQISRLREEEAKIHGANALIATSLQGSSSVGFINGKPFHIDISHVTGLKPDISTYTAMLNSLTMFAAVPLLRYEPIGSNPANDDDIDIVLQASENVERRRSNISQYFHSKYAYMNSLVCRNAAQTLFRQLLDCSVGGNYVIPSLETLFPQNRDKLVNAIQDKSSGRVKKKMALVTDSVVSGAAVDVHLSSSANAVTHDRFGVIALDPARNETLIRLQPNNTIDTLLPDTEEYYSSVLNANYRVTVDYSGADARQSTSFSGLTSPTQAMDIIASTIHIPNDRVDTYGMVPSLHTTTTTISSESGDTNIIAPSYFTVGVDVPFACNPVFPLRNGFDNDVSAMNTRQMVVESDVIDVFGVVKDRIASSQSPVSININLSNSQKSIGSVTHEIHSTTTNSTKSTKSTKSKSKQNTSGDNHSASSIENATDVSNTIDGISVDIGDKYLDSLGRTGFDQSDDPITRSKQNKEQWLADQLFPSSATTQHNKIYYDGSQHEKAKDVVKYNGVWMSKDTIKNIMREEIDKMNNVYKGEFDNVDSFTSDNIYWKKSDAYDKNASNLDQNRNEIYSGCENPSLLPQEITFTMYMHSVSGPNHAQQAIAAFLTMQKQLMGETRLRLEGAVSALSKSSDKSSIWYNNMTRVVSQPSLIYNIASVDPDKKDIKLSSVPLSVSKSQTLLSPRFTLPGYSIPFIGFHWGINASPASLAAAINNAKYSPNPQIAISLFVQYLYSLHVQQVVSNPESLNALKQALNINHNHTATEYIKVPYPHDVQVGRLFLSSFSYESPKSDTYSNMVPLDMDVSTLKDVSMTSIDHRYTQTNVTYRVEPSRSDAFKPPLLAYTSNTRTTVDSLNNIDTINYNVTHLSDSRLNTIIPDAALNIDIHNVTDYGSATSIARETMMSLITTNNLPAAIRLLSTLSQIRSQTVQAILKQHHKLTNSVSRLPLVQTITPDLARTLDTVNSAITPFYVYHPIIDLMQKQVIKLEKQIVDSTNSTSLPLINKYFKEQTQLRKMYQIALMQNKSHFWDWSIKYNMKAFKSIRAVATHSTALNNLNQTTVRDLILDFHGLSPITAITTLRYNMDFLYHAYVLHRIHALVKMYLPEELWRYEYDPPSSTPVKIKVSTLKPKDDVVVDMKTRLNNLLKSPQSTSGQVPFYFTKFGNENKTPESSPGLSDVPSLGDLNHLLMMSDNTYSITSINWSKYAQSEEVEDVEPSPVSSESVDVPTPSADVASATTESKTRRNKAVLLRRQHKPLKMFDDNDTPAPTITTTIVEEKQQDATPSLSEKKSSETVFDSQTKLPNTSFQHVSNASSYYSKLPIDLATSPLYQITLPSLGEMSSQTHSRTSPPLHACYDVLVVLALQQGITFNTGKGSSTKPSIIRELLPKVINAYSHVPLEATLNTDNKGTYSIQPDTLSAWLDARFQNDFGLLGKLPISTAEIQNIPYAKQSKDYNNRSLERIIKNDSINNIVSHELLKHMNLVSRAFTNQYYSSPHSEPEFKDIALGEMGTLETSDMTKYMHATSGIVNRRIDIYFQNLESFKTKTLKVNRQTDNATFESILEYLSTDKKRDTHLIHHGLGRLFDSKHIEENDLNSSFLSKDEQDFAHNADLMDDNNNESDHHFATHQAEEEEEEADFLYSDIEGLDHDDIDSDNDSDSDSDNDLDHM